MFQILIWLFTAPPWRVIMLSVSRICGFMLEGVQPQSCRRIFCTCKKLRVTPFTYSCSVKNVKMTINESYLITMKYTDVFC